MPAKRDCPACSFRLWPTPRARHIRWHEATRHTLASHALMSGAGVASVQAILRHADPRLTIETYGHLSPNFLGEEVNRVSLPGLGKTADTERTREKTGQNVEPGPAVAQDDFGAHGAWVVRGTPSGVAAKAVDVMIQPENRGESEWSRRDLNSRPMHCEGNGVQLAGYPPRVTASQVVRFTHSDPEAESTPSPRVAPRSSPHGAPMVRKRALTHHGEKTASGPGSGRITEQPGEAPPADLLTVQQVADRLAVGRTWVRRRLEAGDFIGVRLGPQGPLLIAQADLDAYLARFPGLVLKEHPQEPEAVAVTGSKKGAA